MRSTIKASPSIYTGVPTAQLQLYASHMTHVSTGQEVLQWVKRNNYGKILNSHLHTHLAVTPHRFSVLLRGDLSEVAIYYSPGTAASLCEMETLPGTWLLHGVVRTL